MIRRTFRDFRNVGATASTALQLVTTKATLLDNIPSEVVTCTIPVFAPAGTADEISISGLRDSSAGLRWTQLPRRVREGLRRDFVGAIQQGMPTCETRSARWFRPSLTVG